MAYSENEINDFLNKKYKTEIPINDAFSDNVTYRLLEQRRKKTNRIQKLSICLLFFLSAFSGYKFSEYYYSGEIDYQDLNYSYSINYNEDYYINYGYDE